MLTIDDIATTGERLETAYEHLTEAIKDAAIATEAANAARIDLAEERAAILRHVDPKDLGPNEKARDAEIDARTASFRQVVADAEREERRSKAALEVAKAEVSAAKRAKEILELVVDHGKMEILREAQRVMQNAAERIKASPAIVDWADKPATKEPAVPAVALDRATGSRALITWMDGRQEPATIVGCDPKHGMYEIVYGNADEARIPASYLSDLPEDWAPPSVVNVTAAPVGPSDDDEKVTAEQVKHVQALADRAFATVSGFTKWLWNTHHLSKPQLDLIQVGQFKTMCGQLEAKIAERERKAAKKAQATDTAEPAPAPEAPPAEEAPPEEEPAAPADDFADDFADVA